MITVWGEGRGFRVIWLLEEMGLPYKLRQVDLLKGVENDPEFLAINPTGAVPAIRLGDGRVLGESSAILAYLAEGTPYLPGDAFGRAKVLQWLSFEQNYVEPAIGTLRHWILTCKDARRPRELLESRRAASLKALGVLDRELASRPFVAGAAYSIADISLFAYASRADEAKLPLGDFANVGAWIARVEAEPGHLATTYPYSIDPHSAGELP